MTKICRVYAITDPKLMPGPLLLEKVEFALRAGIRTIQYRDKTASFSEKKRNALDLVELCRRYDSQLIINDDVELAYETKAHGVHLGQGDMDIRTAREKLDDGCIIGITCHDQLSLAKEAEKNGANYVAFGRFFPSNTKPEASTAPLSLLTAATKLLHIPIVAIGGITPENASEIFKSGANSVAVCHSLFAPENIKSEAEKLLAF